MLGIELVRRSEMPVKRQLYEALKDRIFCGRLKAGEALPSTRELAEALAVSRNTVLEAYAMLLAEGYVICRQGASTVVADGLLLAKGQLGHPARTAGQQSLLADFGTGRPDLSLFPRYLWQQAMRRAMEAMPLDMYGYTGPQGMAEARCQIAAWLFRARGLVVHEDDIFLTAGATHALHMAAELMCGEGGSILAEDPCHTGMRRAFQSRGYDVRPVPADMHGLVTQKLPAQTSASAVYVTPSHQFPLGGILPAARRAALIRYVRERDMYILEDDYDSEFRFAGEPVAPLYAMDPQRVIYIGTFSKTLFPAIRVGFVLLPNKLQDRWRSLRTYTDVQNPPFEQAALSLLLESRKLDRHVQSMRRVYRARRQALLEALAVSFGKDIRLWGDDAGLHAAVQFQGFVFGSDFYRNCLGRGINVTPVEYHCILKGRHMDKLLLGYGHLAPEAIMRAVPLLASAVRELAHGAGKGPDGPAASHCATECPQEK